MTVISRLYLYVQKSVFTSRVNKYKFYFYVTDNDRTRKNNNTLLNQKKNINRMAAIKMKNTTCTSEKI